MLHRMIRRRSCNLINRRGTYWAILRSYYAGSVRLDYRNCPACAIPCNSQGEQVLMLAHFALRYYIPLLICIRPSRLNHTQDIPLFLRDNKEIAGIAKEMAIQLI